MASSDKAAVLVFTYLSTGIHVLLVLFLVNLKQLHAVVVLCGHSAHMQATYTLPSLY